LILQESCGKRQIQEAADPKLSVDDSSADYPTQAKKGLNGAPELAVSNWRLVN